MKALSPTPVIDLFAGPGGLGEGFASIAGENGKPRFRIALSIEKDAFAHSTLNLRAFFRQFPRDRAPEEYYEYLHGTLSRTILARKFEDKWDNVQRETWHAELGSSAVNESRLHSRIEAALGTHTKSWVLIGGPPCQAYSLVGRSRVIGKSGRAAYESDPRHHLYKHYLQVLANHKPAVFVMENVKGLLSATIDGKKIFDLIKNDLQNPCAGDGPSRVRYNLYSLNPESQAEGSEDFVIRCERHGIPQARHRIIIVGVRSDIRKTPGPLSPGRNDVTVREVINDLPRLRSGVTGRPDSWEQWKSTIQTAANSNWLTSIDPAIAKLIRSSIKEATQSPLSRNSQSEYKRHAISDLDNWYRDDRLKSVTNHETRAHIPADLHRYLFAASYGQIKRLSPLLENFPKELLPKHQNVKDALLNTKFNDRFRVQLADRPSTTVVSHISKDGHYFIHYDPAQCRSLTVREAARLQTFPDNYFFEGPRTEQYKQVGNAVPPFLARQIAEIVSDLVP